VARRRLDAHQEEMARWAYEQIARRCREHGVRPVFVFVPTPDGTVSRDPSLTSRLARAAGFQTLDLRGAYDGHDLRTLQLTPFDYHPNALGDRLLGARLARLLADSVLAPGGTPTAERQ
jgi:hypothetical protein